MADTGTAYEPISPIFLQTLAALDKSSKEPQNALAAVVEQKQGAAKAISIKTLLESIPAEGVPLKLRSESLHCFRSCRPHNNPSCSATSGKRSRALKWRPFSSKSSPPSAISA
jgi:hypothetical protein